MDGEKQKVSIEQQMAYTDAVAYLEALLKGFKEGRIVVERGGEAVVLTPPQSVNVEIEARRKGDKQKFSLELEWSAAPAVVKDPLTISADLPRTDDAKPCDKGCPTTAPAGAAKPAEAKPAPAPAKPGPSAPASTVSYGKAEPAKPVAPAKPEAGKPEAPKDAPKPGGK